MACSYGGVTSSILGKSALLGNSEKFPLLTAVIRSEVSAKWLRLKLPNPMVSESVASNGMALEVAPINRVFSTSRRGWRAA